MISLQEQGEAFGLIGLFCCSQDNMIFFHKTPQFVFCEQRFSSWLVPREELCVMDL